MTAGARRDEAPLPRGSVDTTVNSSGPDQKPLSDISTAAQVIVATLRGHVFACRPSDKRPLAADWQTRSLEAALVEIAANPGCNLGWAVPAGMVALDLDRKNGKNGFESLRLAGITLPPTLIATTPSGGEHHIYRLPAAVSLSVGTDVLPGVDFRGQGGYIVVEPSTIGAAAYRWHDLTVAPAAIPRDLLELLLRPKATFKAAKQGDDAAIPEGMRNATLTRVAGSFRAAGLDAAEMLPAIQAVNERRCDPPLDDSELLSIASSVGRYPKPSEPWQAFAPSGAPLPPGAIPITAAKPELITGLVARLQADPPAPEMLWRRIAAGACNLLNSNGGVGKSTLALLIAACAAAEHDLFGMNTPRQVAGFYSAEDGANVLLHRLKKICRSLSIDPAELEGRLHLFDVTDSVEPVLWRGGCATARLDWLRQQVQALGIELLVIDGASDVYDDNEIARREVRAFIRGLAKLGCTVLLIAHVDKKAAKGEGGDQNYSGSTAWNNSVRSRLTLLPNSDGTLSLAHEKSNYGPKQAPIRLSWADGVPVLASPLAFAGQDPTVALLTLIHEFDQRGEYVSSGTTSPTGASRLLSKEPTFPRQLSSGEVSHALREAERAGYIRKFEYPGAYRKPKSRWILTDSGKSLVAPSMRQLPEA